MKSLAFIHAVLLLMWSSLSSAQAGSLDPEFGGGDGQVSATFLNEKPCQAYSVALREDGRIMISGVTRGAGDTEHAVLAGFMPDGSPDNAFNGNGKMIISVPDANSLSQAMAIQPDGKIVVAVQAYDEEESWLLLYRYNPDGSPDPDFGGDGEVITDLNANAMSGKAIALQPDGKILVGGYVGFEESFDMFFIARYLPDGTPDDQFDEDGYVTTIVGETYTGIYSLLVQPDGKIIAAGYGVFDQYDAFAAVRYHANGALDHSFGEDGLVHVSFEDGDDRATDAVLQADGKIVLGGYVYSPITGSTDFGAVRFNTDGTLDNTFHGDGMTTIMVTDQADQPRSMLLQPDGKIVLGGYAHSNVINLSAEVAMVRLNTNGTPDPTFDGDGMAIYEDSNNSGSIYRMAMQQDGKIVGAGVVRTNGLNAIRVARFITGLTVSTKDESLIVSAISLFPNPATEQVRLQYQLEVDETISVQLCDMQGKVLQTLLPSSVRNAGHHSEYLKLNQSLPTGHYLINIQSKNWMKALQVVIN